MNRLRSSCHGVAGLELLLVLAVVALLLQTFPGFGRDIFAVIDVRNWPVSGKLLINVAIVLVLVGIRFAPGLIKEWQDRQKNLTAMKEKTVRAKKAKAEREALERMEESRSRRIY